MPTITLAAITPEKTRTDPTDRSIPAVMITKVMPTARISSPEASAAMLRKLNTVANCWKRRAAKPATMPSRIRKVQVVVSVSRLRSAARTPDGSRRLGRLLLGLGHLGEVAHATSSSPRAPVMAAITCSMVVSAAR